ncbi:MAG: hypothetical protein RLY16_1999 [Bacteroidota bacterium]
MKNFVVLFFAISLLQLVSKASQAQDSLPAQKIKLAIFAPLMLDSVFTENGNFKFKQGMPKFMMPAVDFVNGVKVALDSLQIPGNVQVEASIFDTRSYSQPLATLLKSKKLDQYDLFIGATRDAEYKLLAEFARVKNIPFISATYPNDGGITDNPFVVIVNSTLRAHCEAIYAYLLQNHGTDKLYLIRKKGAQEDKVAAYFKQMNDRDGGTLLPIQTINFDSTVNSEMIQKKLDSNRNSVIIGGSLDEGFAEALTATCFDLHRQHYPIKLFGMPNWDGFKSLLKRDAYTDFPVYYTSPYYNNKLDDYSRILTNHYQLNMNGKPTDMAFKGFECTALFLQLLIKHPNDFLSQLNDKSVKIFTDYNFRPVSTDNKSSMPDYIENKHLYFMQIVNGTVNKAW